MTTKGFSLKGTAKTSGAVKPMAALVAETEKLRAKVDKLDASQRRAGDAVDRFGEKAKSVRGKFGQLAVATAGAAYAFDQVIERSMRLQNVQANLPFAIDKARKSTQGLVDDFKLAQLAIQANRLGVAKSEEDFARLAEAATKLGLSVGKDAASSVDDLVSGLGRGSTELLDNLGIQLRASEAYEQYAKKIHKTANELTDAEKKQAVMTIGLEKAREAASGVNTQVDETTKSWMELKTGIKNFADEVVPIIVGAFKTISDEIKLAQQDLFNFMEFVTGGTTTLLDSLTTTKTRGVAGIGAKPGEAGASAIAAGEAERARQKQRADYEARLADANIQAGLNASLKSAQYNDFVMRRADAEARKKKPKRRGGGGGRKSGNTLEEISFFDQESFDNEFAYASRLQLEANREKEAEIREQMLQDVRDFNDRQFEIEREAARKRDEARQEEFEREKALAEQRMHLGTAVSDAMIASGGAALRAAAMGEGGIKAAVHSFAKSKAIEMGLLAATEYARAAAAAASPLTAPLVPGHINAALQATAVAALAGGIAGATANYGSKSGSAGSKGSFYKDAFGGGQGGRTSERKAPAQGGAILSRGNSSAMVQSQGTPAGSNGGGNSYSFHFQGLGYGPKDEIIGAVRRELNRHEQQYGAAT